MAGEYMNPSEAGLKMARLSHGELVQMEMEARSKFNNTDKCVCCGAYVPEGRMVCIECEKEINNPASNKSKRYIDAEELKHLLNNSKYYGKKAGRDFADMIAECKSIYLPIDKD